MQSDRQTLLPYVCRYRQNRVCLIWARGSHPTVLVKNPSKATLRTKPPLEGSTFFAASVANFSERRHWLCLRPSSFFRHGSYFRLVSSWVRLSQIVDELIRDFANYSVVRQVGPSLSDLALRVLVAVLINAALLRAVIVRCAHDRPLPCENARLSNRWGASPLMI